MFRCLPRFIQVKGEGRRGQRGRRGEEGGREEGGVWGGKGGRELSGPLICMAFVILMLLLLLWSTGAGN